MSRDAIATIHLSALRHNLTVVRNMAPKSQLMAVVKSDAYGHGLEAMLPAFEDADGLAVAHLEEAIPVRHWEQTHCHRETKQNGGQQRRAKKLLLLEGVFDRGELLEAVELDCQMVVHNFEQIAWIEKLPPTVRLSVWLKINTGMNRLGFPVAAVPEARERLSKSGVVDHQVMMTHMANATVPDGGSTPAQMRCFQQALAHARLPVSVANSITLLNFPELAQDWVRPGIVLYGVSPTVDCCASTLGLRPVMTLTAKIIALHDLMPGAAVGYGGVFKAERPMRVATIGIGYADGYDVRTAQGTPVVVDGQLCPLVGRVSMDMITVDVTTVPQACIGDIVQLWGGPVTVETVARGAQTIPYELLCRLTPRVKRRYVLDTDVAEEREPGGIDQRGIERG